MPFVERPPARHDLIWLDSNRWRDALLAPLPDEWMGALGEWFKRGRPAVVRRQESSTANAISLGVALPPARGKTKIPLLVDRRVVTRASAPLLLATALVSAPPAWQAALQSLVDAARERGIEFRVYGSLAWQHLSGEPYLTGTSDVDLLWTARNGALRRDGLQLLAAWQRTTGLAADGELLLPDGAAVAWKELLSASRKVLVKSSDSVAMRARDDVLAGLVGEAMEQPC